MPATEVNVPDIGDFEGVEVIEVLVSAGDVITVEQSLVTVESDKASMEIPSPVAGTVKEIKVQVGDTVAEGTLLLLVDAASDSADSAQAQDSMPVSTPVTGGPAAPPAADSVPAPVPGNTGNMRPDIETDMLVLGAGPGGYSAAFRAADLGMDTVLIERYATLGGVCLNVGCIPSKALLHTASVVDEVRSMGAHGIHFGEPSIDLDQLRAHKDAVVGKLTGGLVSMARGRKVKTVRGSASFLDANHVEVMLTDGDGQQQTGEKRIIRFQKAIIAAGSQSVSLPFLPDDERIVDSTGALQLRNLPERLLVIGAALSGWKWAPCIRLWVPAWMLSKCLMG